eukprot:m.3978 g.3978  ORF g.3978 m.3978 type:complete len:685 (-) comp6644_c0_seq1:88-2142(-)
MEWLWTMVYFFATAAVVYGDKYLDSVGDVLVTNVEDFIMTGSDANCSMKELCDTQVSIMTSLTSLASKDSVATVSTQASDLSAALSTQSVTTGNISASLTSHIANVNTSLTAQLQQALTTVAVNANNITKMAVVQQSNQAYISQLQSDVAAANNSIINTTNLLTQVVSCLRQGLTYGNDGCVPLTTASFATLCSAANAGLLRFDPTAGKLEVCTEQASKDYAFQALQTQTPSLVGTQAVPGHSCRHIRDSGATDSGTYWINGYGDVAAFQVYCDMSTSSGGWTYIARGTSQADSAVGDVSLDPTTAGIWHLSTSTIQAITQNKPYEIYIGHGLNGDIETSDDEESFRIQRLEAPFTFSAPMEAYYGWNGSTWLKSTQYAASSDRGPVWENADPANQCCERNGAGSWISCGPSTNGNEGQFSNLNNNQHLRCKADDTRQDGLIIFLRESPDEVARPGLTQARPGKSCKDIRERLYTTASGAYWIKPTNSPAFQVYCDMKNAGGGWTYVARGSSTSDSATGTVRADLDTKGIWHLSTSDIAAITGPAPYESYVAMGPGSDDIRDNTNINADEFVDVRVRQEQAPMSFAKAMFAYRGRTGSGWSAVGSTGSTNDRGPSWEPNDDANTCCQRDTFDNNAAVRDIQHPWTTCRKAPINLEGQFSNINLNGHLRCQSDSWVRDGLVIFVR